MFNKTALMLISYNLTGVKERASHQQKTSLSQKQTRELAEKIIVQSCHLSHYGTDFQKDDGLQKSFCQSLINYVKF